MIGDILQPTHLLFVLVVALLVLGPKRLPEAGRALGRGIRDFRAAVSGEDQGRTEITTENTVTTQPPPAATEPSDPPPPAAPPPADRIEAGHEDPIEAGHEDPIEAGHEDRGEAATQVSEPAHPVG